MISTEFTIEGIRERYNQIPQAMRSRPQWLLTKEKRPVQPVHWNEPDLLLSFEEALEGLARSGRRADGVGFVFQENGPFVGVDLDDVYDPSTGEWDFKAKQLIHNLNSYTEWSSSRTGDHIILIGERSPEFGHKGRLKFGSVEVYDRDRYFVITGDRYLPEQLPAEPKPAAIAFERLEKDYLPRRPSSDSNDSGSSSNDSSTQTDFTDLKAIRVAKQPTSRDSVNLKSTSGSTTDEVYLTVSKYDPEVARLWRGETIRNITDESRLDSLLVSKLAFWCRGDPEMMDACFRDSERYGIRFDHTTPKWDEIHSSRGETYGEMLIKKALTWNRER